MTRRLVTVRSLGSSGHPKLEFRLESRACLLFVDLAGDFDPAQAADVFRDAAVEGFGNLLAIFGSCQAAFVAGIADEGDFGQDRGHISADENDERRLLHTPV